MILVSPSSPYRTRTHIFWWFRTRHRRVVVHTMGSTRSTVHYDHYVHSQALKVIFGEEESQAAMKPSNYCEHL